MQLLSAALSVGTMSLLPSCYRYVARIKHSVRHIKQVGPLAAERKKGMQREPADCNAAITLFRLARSGQARPGGQDGHWNREPGGWPATCVHILMPAVKLCD